MSADIFTPMGFASSGITGFLAVFYLIRNGFRNDGYLFLYILLLLLAGEQFYKTLIHSKLMLGYAALYLPGRSFNLLIFPVFLFFVFSVTRPDDRLQPGHWLLLFAVPALLLWDRWPALSLSSDEKYKILEAFYTDRRPGPYRYWTNVRTMFLGTVLPLGFIGWIAVEYFRFMKSRGQQAKRLLLQLLAALVLLFYIYYQLSDPIYRMAYQVTGWSMIEWPVDIVFLSLAAVLLSLLALLVNSGTTFLPPSRYASSTLSSTQYDELLSKLVAKIEEEGLFRRADLSLKDLADQLGSNQSYLSQAINHQLGIGVSTFINRFRIEEAKRQLLNADNAHLTIEAIAAQCGFRSKSTFFRAFKRLTGMTPRQYILQQKKS